MALLQISEPGKSTMPHEHRNAVGIDLGTTNSLVAAVISGTASIIKQTDDSNLLDLFEITVFSDPSLVQFLHRNLAYLISIFYFILIFIVFKKKLKQLIKPVAILGLIILLQIILGILTILNGANIIVASLHQFSSILLISSSLYFVYKNRFI